MLAQLEIVFVVKAERGYKLGRFSYSRTGTGCKKDIIAEENSAAKALDQ